MWLHYLKTGVRALLADRFFSFVNLLGLSVGLAAVALIFLYVKNEFSHDSWLPRHETLFRVDTVETTPGQTPLNIAHAPGPLKEALLNNFPQIAGIVRAYPLRAGVVRDAQPFEESVLAADPNFFALLGLPLRSGDPRQALRHTGSVALSARFAEKYFGRTAVVGERLTLMLPQPRDFVVSAVFETIPDNSHMAFDIVIPFASYFGANTEEIMAIPDAWGGAYFHTYARLREGAGAADIERGLPAVVDRSLPDWLTGLLKGAAHDFYRFRFVPMRDVHFDGGDIGAMKPPGSRAAVLAASAVALLILFIASINFANLMTARSTLRAREVAIRKVVGAKRLQIIVQFLAEALLVTACAGLIALALVELSLPYVGGLLGLPPGALHPSQWQLWAGLVGLVLFTAAASGLYPSVVVSRIRPAAALSRDYARRTGGALRGFLVVLQFSISIGLIAAAIVMALQTRFTRTLDLGFDRDNVLIVRLPEGAERGAIARSFRDAVARHPDVVAAALSSAVPSDLSEDNISVTPPGAAKPVALGYHRVDSRFFETYRVTPLEGRTQSGEGSAAVVLNRAALGPLGFSRPADALGEIVRTSKAAYTIVGIVPDLHFRSLHAPVRPEIYVLDDAAGGAVSIRQRGGDPSALLALVDRLWAERLPGLAVDRVFLDEALDALYAKERTQSALLTASSGVAIALSCLGLLAMAAFSVQRRTREIAIRKVLGARTRDIARLLLWEFSRPVLLANLIAWPVAWLLLRDWLNRFAYRIDLPLSAFAAAGLVALAIAFATVGAHAFRVARTSPIAALRTE